MHGACHELQAFVCNVMNAGLPLYDVRVDCVLNISKLTWILSTWSLDNNTVYIIIIFFPLFFFFFVCFVLFFFCSGLAKTILQSTVKGGRRQDRQKKRWEDTIRKWTGLEFDHSQRAVKNREKFKKLVVKSSAVLQRTSRG